jgi:hypothetical protein
MIIGDINRYRAPQRCPHAYVLRSLLPHYLLWNQNSANSGFCICLLDSVSVRTC